MAYIWNKEVHIYLYTPPPQFSIQTTFFVSKPQLWVYYLARLHEVPHYLLVGL